MSEKKICPLRFAFVATGNECIQDKCAWYMARDAYCAIKTLAYFAEAKRP